MGDKVYIFGIAVYNFWVVCRAYTRWGVNQGEGKGIFNYPRLPSAMPLRPKPLFQMYVCMSAQGKALLGFFSELQVKFKRFWIVIVTCDFWDITVLSKGEWPARKQSVFKHSVSIGILFILFVTSATSI